MSAQTYIAYSFAIYCFHVVFCVTGVYVMDRFNLGSGDIIFDLKRDVKRMAICSLIALGPPVFIYYYARTLRLLIVYSLLLVFSLLVAYLGISLKEIFVIIGTNIAGLYIFRMLAAILPLWFMYLLLLSGLGVLIAKAVKKKKLQKHQVLEDMRNEAKVRDTAARNPAFRTFCFECRHFNRKVDYCQRKLDDLPVKEIQKNGNTYCASWQAALAVEQRIFSS